MERIAIGSDHAGFAIKEALKQYLTEKGYDVKDFGTDSEASCDYPDYAFAVAECVAAKEADKGVLVCGTGIGMSMAANKHTGIRAACCSDTFSARMTRMHNDANVLCMGARVVGAGLATDIAQLFLETEFEGGRHQRRVDLVNALDQKA